MEDDKKVGARKGTGSRRGAAARERADTDNLQENQEASEPGQKADSQMLSGATMEFSFDGRPVRTILRGGETWFVAADVCAVLEHSNPTKAVLRLDEDERGLTTIQAHGGNDQAVNVVNESGLYSLIFTSRKPQAKAFRRWVTGEVLPSIRKTGRYEGRAESPGTRRNGAGAVQIALPGYGRFIVMNRPDRDVHVHETEYDAAFQELSAIDTRVLSHHLGLIEGFWHKYQLIGSAVDPRDGFALGKLEETILEGGRLGQHYLRCYERSQG
jgi:prophage antirepressor-like protein